MKSLYLLLSVLLVGCWSKKAGDSTLPLGNETATTDHFSDKATIEYAKNFTVTYHGNYKLVHLYYKSPSRNYEVDEKWVLVQRGTARPELTGELTNAHIVEVPIQSLAVNNKGEMIRIKDLGMLDKVVGVGGADIYDDTVYDYLISNEIPSIGYGPDSPQQQELLLTLSPEIFFFFTTEARGLERIRKHRRLGVRAIPHLGWCEPFFMAKVEWIKFTALFFNLEKKASEIVGLIRSRSEDLKEQVASSEAKQTAFLTFHPAGAYDWWVHRNDYYSSLLKSGGAVNVLQDNGPTHYVPMTNERLLQLARDAEYWFGNSETDARWPPSNYLHEFRSYRNDKVFHYNKRSIPERNAYDWQELAVARPDLVMEDLVAILYPEILPNHSLMFFEKVNLTKN